ncbi:MULTISPECIES: 5'-3' exonuclease [Bacillus]|uniref:5'-3' exonuclease n=1 Tax=Bacillus TaxID=1386 RepID=UPI0003030BCD|nr:MULTISPECIES: 5'-3' exonuclease H3TH domain-containing protein [Bacillus]
MDNDKSSIMLVDGMALLFRAFYATAMTGQFMINSKGIPTNGVQGFLKHLLMASDHFAPQHVAVCWDMGSKTFRSEMFVDYKSNRSAPPVELLPQFDLVKEVVTAFDIPNIGLEGYEADDCIGTIAKEIGTSYKVNILTGDQDILQLIDENISVTLLKKGYGNYEVHNEQSLFEWKGIYPNQMIDLKGLMGDTADNYPGVKGIGEKTAIKLLQQHQTIDGILDNLSLLAAGQRTKINDSLEMLHLSRQLATIKCDVPLIFNMEDTLFEYNVEKVMDMLKEHELKGLYSRFK